MASGPGGRGPWTKKGQMLEFLKQLMTGKPHGMLGMARQMNIGTKEAMNSGGKDAWDLLAGNPMPGEDGGRYTPPPIDLSFLYGDVNRTQDSFTRLQDANAERKKKLAMQQALYALLQQGKVKSV